MPKGKSGKKKPRRELTHKEKRLVQAFLKGMNKKQAALAAGYSPKFPTSSATQALEAIKLKTPEVMDKLGLTVEHLIQKHLTPLLSANETKVFAHEGKIVDKIELSDNTTRRYATRMAFELQAAFPPIDPILAAQVGVEVVVIDIPRPDRSAINVTPNKPAVSPNGDKSDPRPEH